MTNMERSPLHASSGPREVQKLMQLFSDFNKALLTKDRAALDNIISDDYTIVDEAGRVTDKARMVESIVSGSVVFNELSRTDNTVQLFGDNAAVWLSIVSMKRRVREREVHGRYRDAATFMRGPRGWRLAATHLTNV